MMHWGDLKFCANLSFMFTETNSLLERYRSAKECGFTAVECAFPYEYTMKEISEVKKGEGMEQVLINTFPGIMENGELGFAAIPGRERDFQNSVDLALLYAKSLHCNKIHILAGIVTQPTADNLQVYENNLRHAVKLFAKKNIVGLIEPINPVSVPNYFLNNFETAVNIIKSINSPNLKLLLDIFHLQQIRGSLTHCITNYLPFTGHIQIAQVPCRNEPDTPGEIDYKYIFSILKRANYTGWIGLEYRPLNGTQDGLKWLYQGCCPVLIKLYERRNKNTNVTKTL